MRYPSPSKYWFSYVLYWSTYPGRRPVLTTVTSEARQEEGCAHGVKNGGGLGSGDGTNRAQTEVLLAGQVETSCEQSYSDIQTCQQKRHFLANARRLDGHSPPPAFATSCPEKNLLGGTKAPPLTLALLSLAWSAVTPCTPRSILGTHFTTQVTPSPLTLTTLHRSPLYGLLVMRSHWSGFTGLRGHGTDMMLVMSEMGSMRIVCAQSIRTPEMASITRG